MFVPSVRRGNGTGHLIRCLETARDLNNEAEAGGFPRSVSILLFNSDKDARIAVDPLFSKFPDISRLEIEDPAAVGIMVVDRRKTTVSEATELIKRGVLIGIDEGGAARDCADFLIDVLPLLRRRGRPNVSDRGLLKQPVNVRNFPQKLEKVMLTFGGEDSYGLAEILCQFLIDRHFFRADQITVVRGSAAAYPMLPDGIDLLEAPENLRDKLFEYDLVFTSFGLTAYEAEAAGTAVILLNPSSYHNKLSRQEGFPTIGIKRPRFRSMKKYINHPYVLQKRMQFSQVSHVRNLASFLAGLDFSGPTGCPVCGSRRNKAIARFPERSYFSCGCSSVVYLETFTKSQTRYDKRYFFEEYARHYGKTYLEDFDHLQEMSAKRLETIAKYRTESRDRTLLDIGCAYGPFLAEARMHSFDCYGLDISKEAVDHVCRVLKLPAAAADFRLFDSLAEFGRSVFSVVTMWYVIEHFERLFTVLSKVNGLLEKGGIFAFSTPNMTGISGRYNKTLFLENSPADHFTIWSPASARSILRRFGFEIASIRITGVHPERFPGIRKDSAAWLCNSTAFAGRICRLGDTFEVYARKVGEMEHR
jgi:2-polyprenyl-3-methyl-5-hydroxy-6-metoxy-1,4-benzoquinol methylase